MSTLKLMVLLVILAIAVACDIRTRRIPNALVLVALALAFTFTALSEDVGPMQALGGFLIGFGAFFPLYLMRVLGAGDVKLTAVTGAFLGVNATLGAMLAGMAAGGVLAIGYSLYLGRLGEMLRGVRFMLYDSVLRIAGGSLPRPAEYAGTGIRLPYSLAIASGVLIILFLRYWYTGSIT